MSTGTSSCDRMSCWRPNACFSTYHASVRMQAPEQFPSFPPRDRAHPSWGSGERAEVCGEVELQ